MAIEMEWLSQPVPLYALLLALVTTPYVWSDYVAGRLGPLLDRWLPTSETREK